MTDEELLKICHEAMNAAPFVDNGAHDAGLVHLEAQRLAGLRAVFEAGRCDGDTIPVPREVQSLIDAAVVVLADNEIEPTLNTHGTIDPNLGELAYCVAALLARTKETTTDET